MDRRVHVFADEAGNFDFRRANGASQYFILGTVAINDPRVANLLIQLRRDLAMQGLALESSFHAAEDPQAVRDAVFDVIDNASFRFDVTILEKCKTQPHLQADRERFYKMAWHLHFKFVGPKVIRGKKELLVIAASIGTKKRRKGIRLGIADVVDQAVWSSNLEKWQVAFWPAECDPCLQIADYCTWAVQRKYEQSDDRSYQIIKSKIATEFRPFSSGATRYY